jgi:hypothetical protein
MSDTTTYSFEKLRNLPIGEYTEEKGRFRYLPWAKAWELLLEQDPLATFEFAPDTWYPNKTVLVAVKVTAFGISRHMHSAVWHTHNKENVALENPDALDISNARMRCLAKCIALFGIGLSLYLKDDEDSTQTNRGYKRPLGAPPPANTTSASPAAPNVADVPEDKAPKYVVKTTKTQKPLTTPRGLKVMATAEKLGVTRKEFEEALGTSLDSITDALVPEIQRFFKSLSESPKQKSQLLRGLYDAIHDLA